MKRVSFEVAKAIKEVGYSQDSLKDNIYMSEPNAPFSEVAYQPTYLEVWLWLWREKGIYISVERVFTTEGVRVLCSVSYGVNLYRLKYRLNPEDAIIAAIEYLVTNKLIK